ncbi:hypothetical protein BH10ACI1_BH10ACI1_00020 [soil metagenome]
MSEHEIKPPWIEYPGSDPVWAGWRQGFSEQWFHEKWLPFWQNLSPEECRQYLRKHPPPNDEWDFYLHTAWRK